MNQRKDVQILAIDIFLKRKQWLDISAAFVNLKVHILGLLNDMPMQNIIIKLKQKLLLEQIEDKIPLQ